MKLIKSIMPYLIIVIVVVLVRTFIATPVIVEGESMLPNLVNGQVLILKKFDKSFDRFDVVVLNYNGDRLVKRVIGLPGETIEYKNSRLYIDGKIIPEDMITENTFDFELKSIGYEIIPDGYYFVVGDNRMVSKDSRIIGLINKKDILGTVSLSVYPFNRLGFIK